MRAYDPAAASAVERCLEIYRTDPDAERRHGAVEALSWAADDGSLPIVPELLADPDPTVHGWALCFSTSCCGPGWPILT